MEVDLTNKVVLVTGGSGGIGAAISESLARANATVALHFNSNGDYAGELVKRLGNNSKCFQADLSQPQNAKILFSNIVNTYGNIDVLVNNAGVFMKSPIGSNVEKCINDWDVTLAINLISAGILCHIAINHFKERSGGRIINIASRAAFRGETEDYLAYAASKGGLVSLSRSIARSFGRYNIKSFTIAPGFVRTKMTEEFLARNEKNIIENELSLKEMTKTSDIAPVVTFIASGLMDHATGCTIDINAGSYMR